jgi:ATP-dependent RNA helicase DeaD
MKDVKAALERSGRVVLVSPPAPEQVDIWELIAPGSVIVCADQAAALDWVAAAPPDRAVHAVTGLARTARLLKAGTQDVLAAAWSDLAALVSRSALKLAAVPTIVLAWPELIASGDAASRLDELLGEATDVPRIILSWDPGLLTAFLERHARRAPVFGELPLDPEGRPLGTVASAQLAVATPERRLATLRDVLHALDPASVVIWTPDERHATRLRQTLGVLPGDIVSVIPETRAALVLCARVPTRAQLTQLARIGPVVLLAAPYQLAYLRSIAAPLVSVRHGAAADRAHERAAALRQRIADRLDKADVDAELTLLAPLFERFDPALVAGAMLALRREEGAAEAETAATSAPTPWVRLFVSIGRKDRAQAKDLVGAMTRELGVAKAEIGKVDVRDSFTLVDVAPHVAETLIKGLGRVSIRGRRVTARLDRTH